MIGFETIGNATLTVFDGKPMISTDPWIDGNPYFGSWTHSHLIPKKQKDNILDCKYIWLSHGHPDHIDPESLHYFKNKTILIADHYGDRIFNDLKKEFNCIKLKSNEWFVVSKNIRIKSYADWNQDSCLLVELNKRDILFNLNDGSGLGWSNEIKKIIRNYKNRFLLKLIKWGDADMINFYNHHNEFILPLAAEKKPCGSSYSYYMNRWNCNFSIPFSSMHKYVRKDSIMMNSFVTPLKEHFTEFSHKLGEMLPAFIEWNSETENYKKINPKENDLEPLDPLKFGDNWNDDLEKKDREILDNYFQKFDHLKNNFGFLSFKVGSSEHNIKYSNKKVGIQFTCPRNSLVTAILNNIFDDMLIGNFMKVRLINTVSLYPNFTPYVTKYGDNGQAYTNSDLKKYFKYYKLNSANFWSDYLKIKTENIIRPRLEKYKSLYYITRKIKRNLF